MFVPFFSEIKLRGIGLPGYSAGIYDVMRRNNPVFTQYYMRAFSVLYCFMLPISVAGIIIQKKKDAITKYAPAGIMLVLAAVIYTFSGNNVWDHRKVLLSQLHWRYFFRFLQDLYLRFRKKENPLRRPYFWPEPIHRARYFYLHFSSLCLFLRY